MSDYLVLDAVSKALKQILWDAFNADGVIRPLVGSEAAIVFSNPTDTARDSANRLSLWLYQITENEHVKNQPMLRAPVQPPPPLPPPAPQTRAPRQAAQYPPMALNLYFLVTPFAQSDESNHLLLGKSMQVLYDNAIFFLEDVASNIFEELRVIFCRLSLEELTRIWESLREPYRLSVCYLIRVTTIDSRRRPETGLVIERSAGFSNDPRAVAAS
jgi:hypothetical protein